MIRARSPIDWIWPLTGIGFVVTSSFGFLLSTVLAPLPYPSPFGAPLGPQSDIATFFVAARPQVELMSFAYAIAGVFLVCFTAHVAAVIADDSERGRRWSSLALGGGLLAAAFWLLSAMLLWVLARPWTPEQPNLLRALHDLTYLVGGPAHVLMLGLFVGAGAVRVGADAGVPAAFRWVGVVGAVVIVLSATALLIDQATLLLPVGRGLALLWIFGVSASHAWAALRTPVLDVGPRPTPAATPRRRMVER